MGSSGFIRSYCDVYTGLCGGLGHLKIETRLRGERVENVQGFVLCERLVYDTGTV
jgi:hypothetical protein